MRNRDVHRIALRMPKDAVDVLNRIHNADAAVLPALIGYRVPCNLALADDPTVQVRPRPAISNPPAFNGRPFEVGLLGILNGILGLRTPPPQTQGWIAAVYDERHELTGFCLTGVPA